MARAFNEVSLIYDFSVDYSYSYYKIWWLKHYLRPTFRKILRKHCKLLFLKTNPSTFVSLTLKRNPAKGTLKDLCNDASVEICQVSFLIIWLLKNVADGFLFSLSIKQSPEMLQTRWGFSYLFINCPFWVLRCLVRVQQNAGERVSRRYGKRLSFIGVASFDPYLRTLSHVGNSRGASALTPVWIPHGPCSQSFPVLFDIEVCPNGGERAHRCGEQVSTTNRGLELARRRVERVPHISDRGCKFDSMAYRRECVHPVIFHLRIYCLALVIWKWLNIIKDFLNLGQEKAADHIHRLDWV